MTKKSAALSQTTTDGSHSSRATQILAMARLASHANWFAALPPSEKSVLVEIRDRWRAERHITGVSAAGLAKTIIAQMPDLRFPQQKGLAEWLLRSGGEQQRS